MALVAVILLLARFGYRPLFPTAPKKAVIVKTEEEAQTIAKAGMDYLSQLRREGRLPGDTTNDHGYVSISGRLSYHPYSLIMRFNKEGEASTNNYTIVQIKKDSAWQLKRAWQINSNDQIIQEWTIK